MSDQITKITGFKLSEEDRNFLKDYGREHIQSDNMTLALRMIINVAKKNENKSN
tara:strand:+ start:203 stop:364 length:162 start_codon:yes stop_codon:yes gene_type:complete